MNRSHVRGALSALVLTAGLTTAAGQSPVGSASPSLRHLTTAPADVTIQGLLPGPRQPRSVYEATATFEEGEIEAIREHFRAVLDHLRSRDVSHLSPELRQRRATHIERLSEYRAEGVFPRNEDELDLAPVFIDDGGRLCAVAHLMVESGSRPLAERVAAEQKNAYVPEITVPGVAEWITASGLSVEECALIQPSYGPCSPGTLCYWYGPWPPRPGPRLTVPLVVGPRGPLYLPGPDARLATRPARTTSVLLDALLRSMSGLPNSRVLHLRPDGSLLVIDWDSGEVFRGDAKGGFLATVLTRFRS